MPDRIISTIVENQQAFAALSRQPAMRVALVSPQKWQFCSDEIGSASIAGVSFNVLPDLTQPGALSGGYDLCILCCHIAGEEAILLNMRRQGVARLYGAWLWDHHHHPLISLRAAMLADIVFPSHWHERQYLNHAAVLPGRHIPACSRQWSPALIARHFPQGLPVARRDALFGGFGRYDWASERNLFIEQMMRQCPEHALSLGSADAYFQRPVAERLRHWTEHKAHLVVPIGRDLSTRVFEALMTGQIPLVPTDVGDLDRVVPPSEQAALPILRYQPHSTDSAEAAWRAALSRFDADGAAGVARRHGFARDHHSLAARLAAFAGFLRQPGEFSLGSDNLTVFWEQWR